LEINQPKYIFVTGGVVSSLGKGIAASSIAFLLKSRGIPVTMLKLDPYFNVDPGTMSPYQHGEVYVTEDGIEADLDLGHYERFIDENMGKDNNATSGQIYQTILKKERKGEFLGATIQIIPHITDEIKNRIKKVSKNGEYKIVVVEIGGTVGDIEGLPFYEAIRQLGLEVGKENAIYIHLALAPFLRKANELKTKPIQHSVKELRSIGLQPDILLCRAEVEINDDVKKKLALFCNVKQEDVFSAPDVETIYLVPTNFEKQGIANAIMEKLNIKPRRHNFEMINEWNKRTENLAKCLESVNDYENCVEREWTKDTYPIQIALVGKYTELSDAYKSYIETFNHVSAYLNTPIYLRYIDSALLEDPKNDIDLVFSRINGIVVPGGFGNRGWEGKIKAIEYARTKKISFLGICLGLQASVIEFARNVCKIENANSEEFSEIKNDIIHFLPYQEQNIKVQMGGTMRLGAYNCELLENSKAFYIYKKKNIIQERHRHRLEVNNQYLQILEKNEMIISGKYRIPKSEEFLVEIIELKDHPFFIATQFHPEFKSRFLNPHPLYIEFVLSISQMLATRK